MEKEKWEKDLDDAEKLNNLAVELMQVTVKIAESNYKATSERADLIGRFHTKLNQERKGTKYKPLDVKFVAVKVGHLKTADLYHLWKICTTGDSFSKVWFGSLKVK
ncbi:unnamed protein product [marine sediment metagenome]|uniref:Uncharacterized protein n=1 Tax=marine sediment metagenome TaxID=412755 RepID=X1EX08_9ZZZZ